MTSLSENSMRRNASLRDGLEFGVGFNTPVIIRFPFEQMASQFPDVTLVRFNRDYPQLSLQGVKSLLAFTEDINRII